MSKIPEYQRRACRDYQQKYDLIQVRLPKGTKELMQKKGIKSMSSYIADLVLRELQ